MAEEKSLKRKAPEGTELPESFGKPDEPAKKRMRKSEMPKPREVFFLVMYTGHGYSGLQVHRNDPHLKTIEGDLLAAMHTAGAITAEEKEDMRTIKLNRTSRTDKGVSAASNVIFCKVTLGKGGEKTIVEAMNKALPPNIRVMCLHRVLFGFHPKRDATSRAYEYILPSFAFMDHADFKAATAAAAAAEEKDKPPPSSADAKEGDTAGSEAAAAPPALPKGLLEYRISQEKKEQVNRLMGNFLGTVNCHNFTDPFIDYEKDSNTYRRNHKQFEIAETFEYKGLEFCKVKIHGASFMLHQIRRMMGLVICVARGSLSEAEYFSSPPEPLPAAPEAEGEKNATVRAGEDAEMPPAASDSSSASAAPATSAELSASTPASSTDGKEGVASAGESATTVGDGKKKEKKEGKGAGYTLHKSEGDEKPPGWVAPLTPEEIASLPPSLKDYPYKMELNRAQRRKLRKSKPKVPEPTTGVFSGKELFVPEAPALGLLLDRAFLFKYQLRMLRQRPKLAKQNISYTTVDEAMDEHEAERVQFKREHIYADICEREFKDRSMMLWLRDGQHYNAVTWQTFTRKTGKAKNKRHLSKEEIKALKESARAKRKGGAAAAAAAAAEEDDDSDSDGD